MRVLCLNLHTQIENSCAEAFVCLSPQVQVRFPCYIFLEISGSSHLLGGEEKVFGRALQIAEDLAASYGGHRKASGAIADSPYAAQALCDWRSGAITTNKEDTHSLAPLPLDSLRNFEGLQAWPRKKQVENIIQFFQSLGMFTLEEVAKFSLSSFRERWGHLGVSIWNRLHGKEVQVISPFIPRDPLTSYAYFEFPVSQSELLMNQVEQNLIPLFLRLQGLGRFARRIEMILHCEYSDHQHHLSVEPVSPTRDRQLFQDLLKNKFEKISLENPVREVEINLIDVVEKIQQLDFFEPRDNTEDRWRRLISFAKENQCPMGFLQIQASHFPEDSFRLITDKPEKFLSQDKISEKDQALKVERTYAKELAKSPRPSLLMSDPKVLAPHDVKDLKFISRLPVERIDSHWWDLSDKEMKNRDYYFALSDDGQMMWVFQDRMTSQYYLHGYFD